MRKRSVLNLEPESPKIIPKINLADFKKLNVDNTPTEKIYREIMRYRFGIAYTKLGNKTEYSRETIRNSLNELIKQGRVKAKPRGIYISTKFTSDVPKLNITKPIKVVRGSPKTRPTNILEDLKKYNVNNNQAERIYNEIEKYKTGISFTKLKNRTELHQDTIRKGIAKLLFQGRVKSKPRGVYIAKKFDT